MIQACVIYRDDRCDRALNKPAGLAGAGRLAATTKHVDGLAEALKLRAMRTSPSLVHRIDKDTSGVLGAGEESQGGAGD